MTETTHSDFIEKTKTLDKVLTLPLLNDLPNYGKVTVIIIHGGSVFEYKGAFPNGEMAHGFYNLDSQGVGFEGHLNIDKVTQIELVTKLHRGRPSYAIVFKGQKETIFKVFLGRDDQGAIIEQQLEKFQQIESKGVI